MHMIAHLMDLYDTGTLWTFLSYDSTFSGPFSHLIAIISGFLSYDSGTLWTILSYDTPYKDLPF